MPSDAIINEFKAQIITLPIGEVKSYQKNPRKYSKSHIQKIVNSIKKFGWIVPVVISNENELVAGHCRVEAAKLLEMEQVPAIRAGHLNAAQIRAYRIADNKLAEGSTWDESLLKIELNDLFISNDIEIIDTGFEIAEVDLLIHADRHEADDEVPEINDEPAITKLGDIFQLGNHRLICADATKVETYQLLMQDERARIICTDPPFNVPILDDELQHKVYS